MLPVPATIVPDAVTVAVALDPGFALEGLKLTVIPLGAVAVNDTVFVNPLLAVTATVKLEDMPWNMLTELAEGVRPRVGRFTVTPSLAVAVAAPLVPVTVIEPVPAADVEPALTVAVADDPGFTLEGLKVTVTPVGPLAVSITGLVYPLAAPTAIEKVADMPW